MRNQRLARIFTGRVPLALGLLLMTLIPPAFAQPGERPRTPELAIADAAVELSVTSVTARTVRISAVVLNAEGVAAALPDEPVLVSRRWQEPQLQLRSQAEGAPTHVQAGGLWLTVSTNPLRLRIQAPDGETAQDIQIDEQTGAVSFNTGAKPVFGLGQGGPQYDRRGHEYPLTNRHGAYNLPVYGGRVPIPWLVSAEGWALFFHQPQGSIDLTGERGSFTPNPEGAALPVDFFLTMAKPAQIMTEYAELTGYPTMPPLWTFGYQQSHRTLKDFDEVLWVAKSFREKGLPADTLIYLGTGWCPSGWNLGHDSFDFNPDVFSNPAEQIQQLKDLNFRIVMHNTYPPRRLYGSVHDKAAEGDEHAAANYWKRHQPVAELGIDGWWPDAGENLSIEGRLARVRMYWEGSLLDRPNERPFALHRTGYAGMQRIGGWIWSGDVNSTWETLRVHLPIALNTGLSGFAFWGTDIGGFYPTEEYTAEYFVRWFQYMAFAPLFRSHGRTWYTHLPFGWNTGVLGPDEMETRGGTPIRVEQLNNPTVEPITKKYLELRYQMMPYIYTAARDTVETGEPMMRPLWLDYSDDDNAVGREDVYLWGRDILVAPVVEKGATSRALYLPQGGWYDYWTQQRVEGGRELEREVDLETTPLYVREGAIIPMGPVKQYTAEDVDGPLTLNVYPGADGDASVYEDDGTTFDFTRGEWMRILCRWDDAERRLTLALAPGSQMFGPSPRQIEVRLATSGESRSVTFDGSPLSVSF